MTVESPSPKHKHATTSSNFAALVQQSSAQSLVEDTTHRDHALFFNGLLPILDLTSFLCASHLVKLMFTQGTTSLPNGFNPGQNVLMLFALLAPIVLYDRRFITVASRAQLSALMRCFLSGFALLTAAVYLMSSFGGVLSSVPKSEIALWLALGFAFSALTRVAVTLAVVHCVRRGLLTEAVAIIGGGPRAERLAAFFRTAKPITPELLGIFDDEPALSIVTENGIDTSQPTSAGTIDDLILLGKTRRIDWIFLALRHNDETRIASIVHRLKALAVPVALSPPTLEFDIGAKRVDYIADAMPVTLLQYPTRGWRATLRTVGQFLPRWMVTLTTMAALLMRVTWSRTRALLVFDSARGTLLCEMDDYDLDGFMNVIRGYGQTRFGYVVTPNADHFIRLHDDATFRKLYATAEYVLMDSRFLAGLLRVTSGTRLPVCTGSDLTAALFDNLTSTDQVVIIGGSEVQVASLAARFNLRNVAHHNPPMGFIRDEAAVARCIEFVESHSPFRFCLLAVGSPQQEQLAQRLQERGSAKGLALCIGASIDFLTGAEKRAPRWMQRCALEWLFRLMQNPKRLAKRYLLRGPRIFWLIRKTKFVVRKKRHDNVVVPLRAA